MSRGLGTIVVALSINGLIRLHLVRFQMLVLKRLNINSNQVSKASNLTIAHLGYAPHRSLVRLFETGTDKTRNSLQIGKDLGRRPG
jgi:hypothetical protein